MGVSGVPAAHPFQRQQGLQGCKRSLMGTTSIESIESSVVAAAFGGIGKPGRCDSTDAPCSIPALHPFQEGIVADSQIPTREVSTRAAAAAESDGSRMAWHVTPGCPRLHHTYKHTVVQVCL